MARGGVVYYIYVLLSVKNKRRYVGFTRNDPMDRLKGHNNGNSQYTRNNRPFILVYSEPFAEEEKARKRERFLKTGQGRKFLDKIINN